MRFDLVLQLAFAALAFSIVPLPETICRCICVMFPALRCPTTRMRDLRDHIDSVQQILNRRFPNVPDTHHVLAEWKQVTDVADDIELIIQGYAKGWARFPLAHFVFWTTRETTIRKGLGDLTVKLDRFRADRLPSLSGSSVQPAEETAAQEPRHEEAPPTTRVSEPEQEAASHPQRPDPGAEPGARPQKPTLRLRTENLQPPSDARAATPVPDVLLSGPSSAVLPPSPPYTPTPLSPGPCNSEVDSTSPSEPLPPGGDFLDDPEAGWTESELASPLGRQRIVAGYSPIGDRDYLRLDVLLSFIMAHKSSPGADRRPRPNVAGTAARHAAEVAARLRSALRGDIFERELSDDGGLPMPVSCHTSWTSPARNFAGYNARRSRQ
ncbi:hypothetical protein VTO73DRAFT_12089 [Trametes versicolor]